MKLIDIVLACSALEEATALRLPYPKARQLASAARRAKEEMEFFSTEEQKLVARYAAKDENGRPKINGGRVSFDASECVRGYKAEIAELEQLDVEWEIPPVTLTIGDMGAQSISANTIGLLAGIINWEE